MTSTKQVQILVSFDVAVSIGTKKPSSDRNKFFKNANGILRVFITPVAIIPYVHDAFIVVFLYSLSTGRPPCLRRVQIVILVTVMSTHTKCKIRVSLCNYEEHSTIVRINSSIATVLSIQGNSKNLVAASKTE